jgi:hypothetical protein
MLLLFGEMKKNLSTSTQPEGLFRWDTNTQKKTDGYYVVEGVTTST